MNQSNEPQLDTYLKYIKAVSSLSGLFSESKIPFLHYRVAESIFCKSFAAENLSRADIAYDAKINSIGIGIKTFMYTGSSSREKIAEFNAHSSELGELKKDKRLALELSLLRNKRIDFANRSYGIESGIYHCLARQENRINIFETNYDPIDICNIRSIKQKISSLFFEDEKNEYNFNFSKSVLYRKFYIPQNAKVINVEIINDPYEFILELFNQYSFAKEEEFKEVILPLYSTRYKKEKVVPEKSGLNHWNAGGRRRDYGEVYIPIPRKVHQLHPEFFPDNEKTFELILPNKETLTVKVCQEGSKALMSNPNNALSEWLLRDILKLKEREILKYEHLKNSGIDSVKMTKINNQEFKIDFVMIGNYEEFIERSENVQ